MAITWNPPIIKKKEEEEEKKFTWTPSKPIIEEPEVVKSTWKPPEPVVEEPKPIEKPKPIDLSTISPAGYEEPSWLDLVYHAGKSGLADTQGMLLNLGRLLYEGGVQITDKVTDVFDKDLYDPKKDSIRGWLGELVSKSETIAADSWEKTISKNRLKNFVALGGRAVPLSLITLMSGGALSGAFPALAMKIGALPAAMLPFGAASLGGHAKRIEEGFKSRGEEAPYAAQLLGGVIGAMGEVATEAIPFQRWLNVFGGSNVVNRGAKTFLAKYGKLGIDWAVGALTETAQEVAMVPIERAIDNLMYSEEETLFPIKEMVEAGVGGLAMSLMLGALGSTSSSIRSFTETKVDKMLKHDITMREGTLDIAEKIVDETVESEIIPVGEKKEFLPEKPVTKEEAPAQKVEPYTAKVYRGTDEEYKPVDPGLFGKGTYHTTNKEYAKTYGKVKSSTVTLKNPFIINDQKEATAFWDEVTQPARKKAIAEGKTSEEANEIAAVTAREYLESKGYDGVVARNIIAEGDEVVVFARPEPTAEETFVKKNMHKVVPKFPLKDWKVTDQTSLERLGNGIAKEVGLGDLNIKWQLGKSKGNLITGTAWETTGTKNARIAVRLPSERGTGRYTIQEGIHPGTRTASHGNMQVVILHELGHLAVISPKGPTGRRISHGTQFHEWTVDSKGKLWIQNAVEDTTNKDLQKIEIEKARICDKYGLDPKDFKFISLPKGKMGMEVSGETVTDELLKEFEAAGYGIETLEDIRKQGNKDKIDEDKVKVHILTKDAFVKRMMQNNELDPGEQETAEIIEAHLDGGTAPQATPIGTKVAGWMHEYFKSIRSSTQFNPTIKNVSDAILEWDGLRGEDAYLADQLVDTFKTMVPSIVDRELITKWRDMPAKYEDGIANKGIREEALWYAKQLDAMGDAAISSGVMESFLEFYSPHMYKNISEWLKSDRGRSAGAPLGGFLGTKFAHSLQRNITTFEDAEAIGLEPYYDSATLLGEYMYSLSRTIHNKNLIDTLKEMVDENGNRVAVKMSNREAWASKYRMVTHPAFAGYTVIKVKGQKILTKVPLKWKPEVANAIEEIGTPPWMNTNYARGLRKIKGIVKRLIFLNPAIHGWNIFSDVLDEVNFNFAEAFRSFGKGKEIYFKDPKRTREALRAGLAVEHVGNIARRLREEIYDLVPLEGKDFISKGLGKLFKWNDQALWISIVRNAQLYVYDLKRTQGLTPQQAAAFTNDLLGTLPKRYFTNAEWSVASSFFLARNWTISNLRLITGAIGSMANIIPGKALTRKGMSQADMKALAPHYIRHLIKGMFSLILFTNILNKLITDKWALENEPGHKLDIDTGTKDNKGRKIYVVMPLLRYMRDYVGWGTAPLQTLRNKMEPVMRTSLELLVNHSVWQNKQIMNPNSPLPDKLKDAAEYALWSWTPFDQFMDSENEVKTTLQKLMYFTGTWVRRGSSIGATSFNTLRTEDKMEFVRTLNPKQINELYGQLAIGRIYGEVARKLYEFRGKKDYAKEKIDDDIDKLLTGGDITEAIQLMVESGRYKDMSAIKDRIMPYLMLRK